MERHNDSLRSAGAKGIAMKVLFECECGTSVQMPEKFAAEGCRCPCCGNEMLPAEPTLGESRIEIPVVDETVVKGERPNGRGSRKSSPSQPPHLRYRGPRHSSILKRAIVYLGLVVLIGVASLWFIGRPNGNKSQVNQPGEAQKERITLKEPSTGPTTPIPSASPESTLPMPSPITGSTLSETEHLQRSTPEDAHGTPAPKGPLPSERSGVQGPAPGEGPPSQHAQLDRPGPQGPGQESGSAGGAPTGTPAFPASGGGDTEGAASPKTAPPPVKAEGQTGAAAPATTAPKAKTTSEPVQPKGKYTLTLASFKEKERAIAYRNSLKKKDLDAFEWPVAIPGQGTWYRVSVGRFPTRKAAKLYARRIESSLATRPIVNEMP